MFEAVYIDGRKGFNFLGNKLHDPIKDFPLIDENRLRSVSDAVISNLGTSNDVTRLIQKLDSIIFVETIKYFSEIGASWVNLPLITKMISSPGAVYSGKNLDYTTDTLPVSLQWFDKAAYLSESSQFYLELHLLSGQFDRVFCIYNSFRKESADAFHLSEFQHIEFEGKLALKDLLPIIVGLLQRLLFAVVRDAGDELLLFLQSEQVDVLNDLSINFNTKQITLMEALDILYSDTKDTCYRKFTMENFGSWEEVRLSTILKKPVVITEMPLLQIPFYHQAKVKSGDLGLVADCADLILPGYREVVGSGARIVSHEDILRKAETFNLPTQDYKPYLESRRYGAGSTAGFGLGWQRLMQWILRQPYIYEATVFPRSHLVPSP